MDEEHRAFLRCHSRVFLLTRDGKGRPASYPMMGRFVDDGLEFSTYAKSAKVRNIQRDPRVCCVVAPRERVSERQALAVWGRARVSETSRASWIETVGSDTSNVGIDIPPEIRRQVVERLSSRQRIVLRVELAGARFVTPPRHGS